MLEKPSQIELRLSGSETISDTKYKINDLITMLQKVRDEHGVETVELDTYGDSSFECTYKRTETVDEMNERLRQEEKNKSRSVNSEIDRAVHTLRRLKPELLKTYHE